MQEDARILDRASEKLAAVRKERQDNGSELRSGMSDWARRLHQQGVSERAQVQGVYRISNDILNIQ